MKNLFRYFILLALIILLSKSSDAQCNLTLNNVTVCNGSPALLGVGMQFTILLIPSNSLINSFQWTGPNGYTSSEQYPIISNPQPGTYSLTVQAPGCFTNVSASLTLSQTNVNCPTAAFTSSPSVVCSGSSVSFTNQSSPSGLSYFWLFGDGSSSTNTNPTNVYTAPQGTSISNFTASLVVINAAGVMSVEQNTVQVQQIPGAPAISSSQLMNFNGQEYIRVCTPPEPSGDVFIFGLVNNFGSWAQSYSINWGDGSPPETYNPFPAFLSHLYPIGLYNLTVTVLNQYGCSVSRAYNVFVGNTPAVSLGSLGDTEQCSPYTFTFPIDSVENNVAGTIYTVTFSDGGATQIFNHPPPPFVTHTFTQSSCGFITPPPFNLPDAFYVEITAQNPCNAAVSRIQPIRISTPPLAQFTAQPDPVCVNTTLTVNSTADPGTNVNSSGCNTNHGLVWNISPAMGWSLTSGTLGSVNGQPTNYSAWTNGSNQLELNFTIPGNYTISQRIRNSCGEDVATEVVCIVLPLTANFNITTPPCAPFVLSPDNLTNPVNGCVPPTYQWNISPTAPFNTNIPPYTSASFEPEWFLTEDGDYTVTLSATNACGTSTATDNFTIVAPPEVNILPIPPGCNPYTVNATATYNAGGGTILTQQWQVNGGPWQTIVPSEPVNFPPQTFASGTHTIKVRITNECGIDSSTVSFIVTDPPIITVPDFQACIGETVIINSGLPTAIGTPPLTYFWTGNGLNNNSIANPSITLNDVGIQTITVTVTDALGCSSTNSVNVSVNPLPILNALPNSMCIGDAPVPLSVSSNISGTTFSWSPSNGLNTTSGSSVLANPQVTTTYTIVGLVSSTGCSSSINVELTVHPLPVVSTVPIVQVCAQPIPLELNQGSPIGGIWSDPTPSTGSITENSGVYFYTPAITVESDSLLYSYTNQNGCVNTAILPILILPVEEASAGLPQSLCLNSPSMFLNSGNPIGGTWSGAGVISGFFNPQIAGVGTHSLVYTINQGTTCESSDTVIYNVLPIPLVDTGLPVEVCAGITANLSVNASGGTGILNYSWSPINNILSGQGTDQIQVSTSPSFNQLTANYVITVSDENNCEVIDTTTLVIHPIPQVNAGPDSILCNLPIIYPLNGSPVSGANGIGVWSGSSSILLNAYNPENLGSDTLTYTFTDINGCTNNDELILTTIPATIPDAGADFNVCNNASPVQLLPASISGGIWNGPGTNTSGLFNPSLLFPGSYTIEYTINSGTTCEASDDLNVIVYPIPVVNSISDSVCSGNSITITPQVSNGNEPYSYLWSPVLGLETPPDQPTAIFVINNSSSISSLFSYTLSVTDSNNCSVTSALNLTVNPLPIVSAGLDTSICFAPNDPYLISGFSPNGGQWLSFPSNLGTLNGLSFLTGGVGADTLSYTYTDFNGCSNTDSLIINVTSPIEVNAGPRITICENDPIFDLPMPLPSNPPVNYTASWVGNGVFLQGSIYRFDPSLASPGLNILNYSFEFGATCAAGTQLEVFVGVLPAFSLPNIEVCTGVDTMISVTINNSTGIAPFSFVWSSNSSLSNLNSQSVIYSAFNNSNTTLLDPLLLSVTDSIGCVGSRSSLITIHPLPQVNAGPDSTLCDQPIPFTLQNYSPTLGGTGIWSGASSLIGDIFTPGGTGSFQLTYTFTDNNGCTASDDLNVTVVPPVFPDAGPDLQFCLSDNDFVLLPQTMQGGQWSGAGVVSSGGDWIFSPSAANIGMHIITYTVNSGTTCQTSDTRIFRVFPIPSVNAGNNIQVCSGSDFNLTGSVTSGTAPYQYQWTPSLGLIGSISEASVIGNLINSSADDIFQVYYLTVNDSAGCSSFDSVTVFVHPLPHVNAGPDSTLCDQPITYTLLNFSPTSGGTGIWSGSPNLSGNTFTPNGTGSATLIYTFTDTNGCSNSDNLTLTIVPPVFPNAGPDLQFCLLDDDFILIPQSQTGGEWSGPGVVEIGVDWIFLPSLAGVGSHILTYKINSGTTCETIDTRRFRVFPMPVSNAGENQEVCSEVEFSLAGAASSGTASYQFEWSPLLGLTSPANSSLVTGNLINNTQNDIQQVYYLSVIDSVGCLSIDSLTITIHPLPEVSAGSDSTLCDQPITYTLLNFSPTSGGTGIWSGSPNLLGNAFIPNGTGSATLTYTFTDANGCSNSDNLALTIVPPVFPNAGPDLQFCSYETITLLVAENPLDGIWSGSGISSVGNEYFFNPESLLPASFTAIYTINSGTTCETSDTIIITVLSPPLVDAGLNRLVCISDSCVILEGFSPSLQDGTIPASATFFGEGGITQSGTFCPNSNLPGDYSIFYQYSDPASGCVNLDSLIISVYPLPIANFLLPDTICINSLATIQNLSLADSIYGGNFISLWTLYDNNNTTLQTDTSHNFSFTPLSTGLYYINLQLISDVGCISSISQATYVLGFPNAAFSILEDTVCLPASISLLNNSSGLSLSYSWTVTGLYQNNSSQPLPIDLPTPVLGDTTFSIQLSLSNQCGVDNADVFITGRPNPVSLFSIENVTGCSPFVPIISNQSYGAPNSFYWDFGNGINSTENNPSLIPFIANNNDTTSYLISLISFNECGLDTFAVPILVLPNLVNAFFNTNPPFGCANLYVNFTNFSTGATEYIWDFGDGTPLVSSTNSNHVFANGGTYLITLIATDGCGFDTATSNVTVLPKPDVSFMPNENAICKGSILDFVNTSSGAAAYLWNFGDSQQISSFEPSHQYMEPGIYTVTLIGYSPIFGCPDTASQLITVQATPEIDITFNPSIGCMPLSVQFINFSQNVTNYNWDFGNGITSTAPNPITVFNIPGEYEVLLEASNFSFGNNLTCSVDTQVIITVYPKPISEFNLSSEESCGDSAIIEVVNNSTGASSYLWKWNTQESFQFNPQISILDTGITNITLVTNNEFGCTDTSSNIYRLTGQPDSFFTIKPATGCEPLSVTFHSTSLHADSWEWNFGDGNSISGSSIVEHVYNNAGVFNVSLETSNNAICYSDTIIHQAVSVLQKAVALFEIEPQIISLDNSVVNLSNLSLYSNSFSIDFGDGQFYNEFISQYVYIPESYFESYIITLTANNANNCPDTLSKKIEVIPTSWIYLPNAFTPNGDGINDAWGPVILGELKYYELLIFDRWGEEIFSSKDKDIKWDGWYKGKIVQTDVYVYRLVVRFENEQKEYNKIGRVTVYR